MLVLTQLNGLCPCTNSYVWPRLPTASLRQAGFGEQGSVGSVMKTKQQNQARTHRPQPGPRLLCPDPQRVRGEQRRRLGAEHRTDPQIIPVITRTLAVRTPPSHVLGVSWGGAVAPGGRGRGGCQPSSGWSPCSQPHPSTCQGTLRRGQQQTLLRKFSYSYRGQNSRPRGTYFCLLRSSRETPLRGYQTSV